jgi:hypothetical protein
MKKSLTWDDSTKVLTVKSDNISKTVTLGSGTYVKSLYIEDLFLFVPTQLQSSSDSYYKYKFTLGLTSGNNLSTTGYSFGDGGKDVGTSKVVVDFPYRIESDKIEFDKLVNTWI